MPHIAQNGASGTVITADAHALRPGDNGKTLIFNFATALTVSPGLAPDFQCMIIQAGAGRVTVSPALGVTINNRQGQTKTAAQYAVISLVGVAPNVFVIAGDTAA